MKDSDGKGQSGVLGGLGAVSVRVDAAQDVMNAGGLHRSHVEKRIFS